jgi:hypothetical protein
MTQDEIIEMARQAGFVEYELDDGTINAFDKRYEAFAKLVAAKAIADLESQERNFCPRCGKRTNDIHTCTPPQGIYYSPPQRTWVGIDEAEIIGLTCECIDEGEFNMDCAIDFAKAIEAKLKELNA